jgi:CheY-like chemotaxis protein
MVGAMKPIRLLLVEDNPARYETFLSWLPAGVRLVWARNAGAALGILQRDRGDTYAGVLIDFDLQRQVYTDGGEQRTGEDVMHAIVSRLARSTSLLVHSMNERDAGPMATALDAAGFPTTRIRMKDLTQDLFQQWVEEAREEAAP